MQGREQKRCICAVRKYFFPWHLFRHLVFDGDGIDYLLQASFRRNMRFRETLYYYAESGKSHKEVKHSISQSDPAGIFPASGNGSHSYYRSISDSGKTACSAESVQRITI